MPLFALTVLLVFVHITYTGGRVALSLYALQLQASAFTVGVLLSLLAVIPMFMSVPIGRWTDRAGPTLPTLLAILLTAAGLLSVWALQSVAGLYLNSLLLGSGFMLAHIAINNAVGQISTPDNRKSNFSFLSLGFSTSSVLGPVIAGFAIDHVGHARTFLILAGFALAALGAWLLVRKHSRSAPAGPAPPANAHVMDLLRDAPLRAIFIISGLLSMGWDLFNFMVPLQGARIGLSASTIGLIMGTFGAATFVVRLTMPWIARNLSEWRTLCVALAVSAGVYLLFPLFTSVPVLLALAFVLGLGLGSTQPMVMSLIHVAAPPGRSGEAVGVRTTVMNASHAFLPLTFGALGAAFGGMAPIFWILALIMAGGAVFSGKRKGSAS